MANVQKVENPLVPFPPLLPKETVENSRFWWFIQALILMMARVEIGNSVLVSVLKYWHRMYEVYLVFIAGLDDDLNCLKITQFWVWGFFKRKKKVIQDVTG